jgi:hypothetical protein
MHFSCTVFTYCIFVHIFHVINSLMDVCVNEVGVGHFLPVECHFTLRIATAQILNEA